MSRAPVMQLTLATLVTLVACANDPVYIPGPMNLEGGLDDGMGELTEATAQLVLPIELETMEDALVRAERTAALGIEVPYVKIGDIEVSVEWTIKNLEDREGIATVELNGATEFFEYNPDLIVLSNDDEAPPTPGLDGNIPIRIPALGSVSGLFTEDAVREASIDLEQITRGNINPFAATLNINKNATEIRPLLPYDPMMPDLPPMPDPNAMPIPREAFAQMIRIDLVFAPSHHMVLEYAVRIRDVRGIVADELLAAPVEELTQFMPMPFSLMAAPGT